MEPVKAILSRLRLPTGAAGKLASCLLNCRGYAIVGILVIVALVLIMLFNLFAPHDEQGFLVSLGYREKEIVAQLPCPVYKGNPFKDDFIQGQDYTYCSLGTMWLANERATGKEVSILTLRTTDKKVLSPKMQSLLAHHGVPGKASVLAVYVDIHVIYVVFSCKPVTLSWWDIMFSKIDLEAVAPNLYRNVHGLIVAKAVSEESLVGNNFVFNASSAQLSDPLVLSIVDANPEIDAKERGLASAMYDLVRAIVISPKYASDMGFSVLLQALKGSLEPAVAIFHSQTHFNVSEVHYCFEGQFELLSPNSSRLLGLYQTVFGLQELQPWQEHVIMVHPLSTFGYPTIDYKSTLNGSSWNRLFFWSEPFSACGTHSTPLSGISMANLTFRGDSELPDASEPCIN